MKQFGNGEQILIVNHETNTIYNDVVKYDKSRLEEAIKQYNSYPQKDATVMIRGFDG